jgi:CheY-like chemotaxis protein
MAGKSLILWAEDGENDAFLFTLGFRKAALRGTVVRVHDGEEAIQYLTGKGCYADRGKFPLPSLLLLDGQMPRMNGFDVLAWKQSQPDLRELPTVIFSSCSIDQDVKTARLLGASAYLVKPNNLEEMPRIVQVLTALQS